MLHELYPSLDIVSYSYNSKLSISPLSVCNYTIIGLPLVPQYTLRKHMSELHNKTIREKLWDPCCDRRAIDTAMSEVDFSPLQKNVQLSDSTRRGLCPCLCIWITLVRHNNLSLNSTNPFMNDFLATATITAIRAHPELHTNLVKAVEEEAPELFASDARDQVIDYSSFMVTLCKWAYDC